MYSAFMGDLLFIVSDNKDELFHFSISTLVCPQGTARHPSSLYLNRACISFEKDCKVPFPPSFALQIICYKNESRYVHERVMIVNDDCQ